MCDMDIQVVRHDERRMINAAIYHGESVSRGLRDKVDSNHE